MDHLTSKTWLFDLDNTLYPLNSGLFDQIRARIADYLVERCGVDNFSVLQDKVADIIGNMEWSADADPIFKFGELLTTVQMANLPKAAEPIPNFFSLVFPVYVAAMMDDKYYLSDIELLALCKCTDTNVVIFKHNVLDGSLVCLRSHIISADLPVLTSIQVNPYQSNVRSHFEQLRMVSNPCGALSSSSAGPPLSESLSAKAKSSSEEHKAMPPHTSTVRTP